MYIFIFICIVLFVGFCIIVVTSIKTGAIYVPSLDTTVKDILDLADIQPARKDSKKKLKAIDLGSGDGRIVIELARAGAEAHGYEINPLLVLIAKIKIILSGQQGKAHIHLGSFFNVDLSTYDVITIFVVRYMMKKIEKKVVKDLKKGGRVIVESFPFGSIKYVKKRGNCYLYIG